MDGEHHGDLPKSRSPSFKGGASYNRSRPTTLWPMVRSNLIGKYFQPGPRPGSTDIKEYPSLGVLSTEYVTRNHFDR